MFWVTEALMIEKAERLGQEIAREAAEQRAKVKNG